MRIPIKIKFYKKSPLASVINWMGTFTLMIGIPLIVVLITGDFKNWEGVVLVPVGILCKIFAPKINEKKVFKLWFKELKEKGIEQEIARSVETAIAVYQANPHKRTLEYINALNPQASAVIQRLLAEKNKTGSDS